MAPKVPAGCYPRGPEDNGWTDSTGCTGALNPDYTGWSQTFAIPNISQHEKMPVESEHIKEKPEFTQEELDSIRMEILKSPRDERVF
jgi:hypothetical protein